MIIATTVVGALLEGNQWSGCASPSAHTPLVPGFSATLLKQWDPDSHMAFQEQDEHAVLSLELISTETTIFSSV